MNNLKKNTANVNILNLSFHSVRNTVRFLRILRTDLESIITDIVHRTSRYIKRGDLKASMSAVSSASIPASQKSYSLSIIRTIYGKMLKLCVRLQAKCLLFLPSFK